jgi:hypothetical protein
MRLTQQAVAIRRSALNASSMLSSFPCLIASRVNLRLVGLDASSLPRITFAHFCNSGPAAPPPPTILETLSVPFSSAKRSATICSTVLCAKMESIARRTSPTRT